MKLASLKRGRDGALVVVSDDLAWYADAGHIVPTLQAALDDWDRHAPSLEALATDVRNQAIPLTRFHEHDAASPLPRAYQWVEGSAYASDVALVRRSAMPDSVRHDPPMDRGGSDGLLGPRDAIPLADERWGCDFGAQVVVVTGDVPAGASRDEALGCVRLVGIANAVSLRDLIPGELGKGSGLFQSRPASALSPVFVTPGSLGDWWRDGKLRRRLNVDLNGQPFGRAEAGEDMAFDFGTLIAHAAKARGLGAGTIVGSGIVSNRDAGGGPGKPVGEGGVGYSCLAEIRAVETVGGGEPVTPFLKAGDLVRIWAEDDRHHGIFGAIEQMVGVV